MAVVVALVRVVLEVVGEQVLQLRHGELVRQRTVPRTERGGPLTLSSGILMRLMGTTGSSEARISRQGLTQ